ncbi:MAG TPA: hypothetical protein VNK43_00285, partial [Gemmatimonadales bacterium]|nr:hypothetical protein [Gemmatimonadales bacterium]
MTTIGPARAATGYATATAPSSLFLTGIAAGVITGAVEIGVMAVEALARRRFLFLPREAVWMAPAAAVATFAIPAAGFALLARIRPSPGLRRAAAAGYALLGCGSVLLWYPQLHWSSRLLLAAGIAARVASRTSSAWPAVARAARRVAVVGVTATLGLALAMAGWRLRTERR